MQEDRWTDTKHRQERRTGKTHWGKRERNCPKGEDRNNKTETWRSTACESRETERERDGEPRRIGGDSNTWETRMGDRPRDSPSLRLKVRRTSSGLPDSLTSRVVVNKLVWLELSNILMGQPALFGSVNGPPVHMATFFWASQSPAFF